MFKKILLLTLFVGFSVLNADTYDSLKRAIEKGEQIFIDGSNERFISSRNAKGQTLLMFAAKASAACCYTSENIKTLIKNGSDLEARDNLGRSVLTYAVESENIENLELIVKAAPYLIDQGDLCTEQIQKNDGTIVKNVFFKNCVTGKTPVMYAAYYGHKDMILMLQSSYEGNKDILMDYTEKGWNAMMFAVQGSSRISELVDVNIKQELKNNYKDVINYLNQNGVSFKSDKTSYNALMLGAGYNVDIDILQMLVDFGCDVNAQDENGKTALMYASIDGYEEIVRFLLANNADLFITDNVQHKVEWSEPTVLDNILGKTDSIPEWINWTAVEYAFDRLIKAEYEYYAREGDKVQSQKRKDIMKKCKSFYKFMEDEMKQKEKSNIK